MFTSKIARSVVAAAIFAALPMTAATSFAADEGGVKVTGNLYQSVYSNGVNNTASGYRSKADTSIGSINDGVEVTGNLTQYTTSYNANNTASGSYTEACLTIGQIGDSKVCD